MSDNEIMVVDGVNIDLIKLDYVQSPNKPKMLDICKNHLVLNFKYVEAVAKKEGWEKLRIAYINDDVATMQAENVRVKEKLRGENSNLAENLFKLSYNQLSKRILEEKEIISVDEVIKLGKFVNETVGIGENKGGSVNVDSKTLNVNFHKPVEEMTIEELNSAVDTVKKELF